MRSYDVGVDGQRFLFIRGITDSQPQPPVNLVLVQNWFEELKRRAPPEQKTASGQ